MLRNEDYYSGIIPDDGLISDYEFSMKLNNSNVMDELLNHEKNQLLVIGVAELQTK